MKISDVCISRPVFATVLALVLVLLGAVSFERLQIREYPNIDEPVVTVRTDYPGASAEIIESQVTKPLEDSVAGIEGVDVISSVSRTERSQITVRFRLDRDPDSAAADVRDRVSRVRGRLPADIDEPIIAKVEADARAVVWLAFSSETRSPLEVSDLASRLVKPRLQTLPGAADVQIFGDRVYSMRIWIDPDRLAAFRLSPADIEDAIRRQNVELPSGRIESDTREFNVVSRSDLNQVSEFEKVVVRVVDGYPVRIVDVARVEIAAESERSIVRYNGAAAVGMGLIKQATANPLILAKALRETLPQLQAELPEGVKVNIAYDSTVFIDRSIDAVFKTIAEAVILVGLVTFLFLGRLRAALIPVVTIPVCLVSAFSLMDLFGFSINTLTLLALVVAIGLVVDDAIVVLENVYRHIEQGLAPIQAAYKGAREVGFAVVAMTMTLAAVFAPVAFSTGRTGRLFTEFALTLAGAVIVSGFLALTLSPMMCSRLLRQEPPPRWFAVTIDRWLRALTRGYRRVLSGVIRVRWLMVGLAACLLGGAGWMYQNTRAELAPTEDRGVFMTVFSAPEGASISYTNDSAREIEAMVKKIPEFYRIFMISGNPTATQGLAFSGLVDWSERDRSVQEVVAEIQPKLFGLPAVRAFAVAPPSLGASPRSRPINLVVKTSDSYEETERVIEPLLADMRDSGLMQGIDTDLKLNKPEFRVRIDRDRAADAGVAVDAVGKALETMLGGRRVTRFKQNNEEYNVIVQLEPGERTSPEVIESIFVRGREGVMVPLSALVSVNQSIGARELNHFGQRRAITITASLAPNVSMGEAMQFIGQVVDKHLPDGYATDYDGPTREFVSSSSALLFTFVLALLFIYLVLSAQFESFVDPFTILFTVPLSLAGGLALLKLTGGTLNVYSQIGLITLVGLITKHGILIVEFANQMRDAGADLRQAIIEAASLRLRPILMTTAATVLGALPLAIATGAGSESRVQIGMVIVGGMSFGTLMTLFVVPAVYYLFARERHPVEHAEQTHPASVPPAPSLESST
ncbi:MAG: efflux RND transporter permease subunit [Burkholderiaceae bacterium]